MRSVHRDRNRNGGYRTKLLALVFSIVALTASLVSVGSGAGVGVASASPAPRVVASPAKALLPMTPTCTAHTYWISEIQLYWGPTANIPQCSYVNIVAYRLNTADIDWYPRCYGLGGHPVITNPENVAICYGWYIAKPGYTPSGVPPDNTIAISQVQMVWGPPWYLPHGNFVKIMAYKASGSDANWIFWCAQFYVVSYDDTGNIGSCTVLW